MPSITERRRSLQAAVEPLLTDPETVSVATGPSTYEGGLNRLGFLVTVTADTPERLDELLDPQGGVKAALEATNASVVKSSGYQRVGEQLAATWTAQTLS